MWVQVSTLFSRGVNLDDRLPMSLGFRVYKRGLALSFPGWMAWEYSAQGLAVGVEDLNVTAEETEEEHPTSLESVGWQQGAWGLAKKVS